MSAAMAGNPDTPDPSRAPESEPTAPAPIAPAAPEQTPLVSEAKPQGPIPFDRHEAILKNARDKAVQDAQQRFQQEHGEALSVLASFRENPGSAIADLIAEGMANPHLAPVIAAAAARALAGRRGQAQAPAEEPEPQADLQLPDGTTLYSSAQQAKRDAWLQQQLMAKFEQQLAPIKQREEATKAREQHQAAFDDAKSRMSKVLDRFKSRPHFTEHKVAIREKAAALMNEGVDAVTALGEAYAEILETTVIPAKASANQQALVQRAVEQSKGSTAPPSGVIPSSQTRPRSMADALRQQGVTSL